MEPIEEFLDRGIRFS